MSEDIFTWAMRNRYGMEPPWAEATKRGWKPECQHTGGQPGLRDLERCEECWRELGWPIYVQPPDGAP